LECLTIFFKNLILRKFHNADAGTHVFKRASVTRRQILHPSKDRTMKSAIAKRSIVLDQHKTSISLEDDFWNGVRAIADRKKMKLTELLAQIDSERNQSNLSSAIRVFVLNEVRAQAGLLAPEVSVATGWTGSQAAN
jgi:predicted DNA-binding ribbon-helix-helix protein